MKSRSLYRPQEGNEERINRLFPQAALWMADVENRVNQAGRPLSEEGHRLARLVDLAESSRVKVLVVAEIPEPRDEELLVAMRDCGVLSGSTEAMTFGNAICVRLGKGSAWLLARELARVNQFQRLGLTEFLVAFLGENLEFGFPNGPMEQEIASKASDLVGSIQNIRSTASQGNELSSGERRLFRH